MIRELSVVIAGDDRHLGHVLSEIRKIKFVPIHLEIARPAQLKETLGRMHPHLVIYDTDGDTNSILKTATQMGNEFAEVQWAVVSKETDVDLILQFFRSGAIDFLKDPIQADDLKRLIQNVLDKVNDRDSSAKDDEHHTIALFSTKGGVGLTTIASNLAVEFAKKHSNDVLLLDLVLQHGNIADVLDLGLQYSLTDVIENFERLDAKLLANSLMKHKSGCYVLPSTKKPDDVEVVTSSHTAEIFQFLKGMFRYVITDVGHEFSRTSISFLDIADLILLVTTPDVLSLVNTRNAVDTFKQLGYSPDKIKLVLNRARMKGEIDPSLIKKNFAMEIFCELADDPITCLNAINQGKVLSELDKNAGVSKGVQRLGQLVSELQKKGTAHVAQRTSC
ncbi:MAG: AAA family ATPase [Candidatus Omnitrophica bacterium]|nr:AAA family ATPase [Candidatus Omnitrophota bacterium]